MTEPVHVAEGVVEFKSIEVEKFVKLLVSGGSFGGILEDNLVEMTGVDALPVLMEVDVGEEAKEVVIGEVGLESPGSGIGRGITEGLEIALEEVGLSVSFVSESIGRTGGSVGGVKPVTVEAVAEAVLPGMTVDIVDEDVVELGVESPRPLGWGFGEGTEGENIEGSWPVLSGMVEEAVGSLLDEVTGDLVGNDVELLEADVANVVVTSN